MPRETIISSDDLQSYDGDNIAQNYISSLKEITDDNKDYFSYNEDGDLVVNEIALVEQIKELLPDALPYNSEASKQFEGAYLELESKRSEDGSEKDDIDVVLFLYGQLNLARRLKHEQEVFSKISERKKQIKDANDQKQAHKVNKDSKRIISADPYQEISVKNSEAKCKKRITFYDKIFNESLKTKKVAVNPYSSDKKDQMSAGTQLTDSARSIAKLAQNAAYSTLHTIGKGVITHSNPAKDHRWQSFLQFANTLLADSRNSKNQDLDKHLKALNHQFEDKIIDEAEFNALSQLAKEAAGKQDEIHQKYLDELQKTVENANKQFLEKVKEDIEEKDDLNKYKMVQILLICSPFMPLPIVGFVLQSLQPFLSGMMDFPQFLSHILSTDGPFGELAFVTDKMQLDKLVDITIGQGGIAGGPMEAMNFVMQNPITTPIMGSLGSASAGSPLTGFAAAAFFGGFWMSREFGTTSSKSSMKTGGRAAYEIPDQEGRRDRARGMLSKSKRDLSEQFDSLVKKYQKDQKSPISGKGGFFEKELDAKKNLFAASNAANWLQINYNINQEAVKNLVRNIVKDSEEAEDILDKLNKSYEGGLDYNTDLTTEFYENKGDLFKKVLMLRDAEKSDNAEVETILNPQTSSEDQAKALEKINDDKIISKVEEEYWLMRILN